MEVRNCKICKKLFNYTGDPLCPVCNKEMEKKFQEVKEYIRENPSVSISTISEETEVPVQQLKRWIREERLTFSKDSGVTISCEKCGAPILTGRYCNNCKKTMTDSLEGLYKQKVTAAPQRETKSSARMRFLDK